MKTYEHFQNKHGYILQDLAKKEMERRNTWLDLQAQRIMGEWFWKKAQKRNRFWNAVIKSVFKKDIEIRYFRNDPFKVEIWYKGEKYSELITKITT